MTSRRRRAGLTGISRSHLNLCVSHLPFDPASGTILTLHFCSQRGLNSPYRTLFPFFLIIVVVLLLIWRLVVHPSLTPPPPSCAEGQTAYRIKEGDTCWDISQRYGVALGKLKEANSGLDCDRLAIGKRLCVPPSVKRRTY